MRNAVSDSDGYEDPDSYQVDEVPKTLLYATTVPYLAQVITASRVAETSKEEESQGESQPNTSFQSENKTNYKYAFGSRVKMEEEFDKGLGIVGVGRGTANQKKSTGFSNHTSSSEQPKTVKKKVASGAKGVKKVTKSSKPSVPKPPVQTIEEEEKRPPTSSGRKEHTPVEIELVNQKAKLEKELNLVAKEEQKLEMLRKKRKELYSNPFKHIKDPTKEETKKGKKKKGIEGFDGK